MIPEFCKPLLASILKESGMSEAAHPRIPLLLWPVWAIWRLLTFILEATGRLVIFILGAVLLVAGVLISLTVIGAIVGIPLAIIGVLLLLRGLF
jgi:hypothetical protein